VTGSALGTRQLAALLNCRVGPGWRPLFPVIDIRDESVTAVALLVIASIGVVGRQAPELAAAEIPHCRVQSGVAA